jgi:hypothetical protein
MFKRNYSVFVGGSEVNRNYLNKQQAWSVAKEWASDGYDDVVIRRHASEIWEVLPILLVIVPIVIGIMVKLNEH